jgi:hypothetical protein
MTGKIQSILFDKSKWSLKKAKDWLVEHNYKTDVDEKPHFYRFRQYEPQNFKRFRTHKTDLGIEFVFGF